MEFITCFGPSIDKTVNTGKVKHVANYNSAKEKEYNKNTKEKEKDENGGKRKSSVKEKKEDVLLRQKINDVKLDTDSVKVLEYKTYNEEIDYGNNEYKLKLNNINAKRMEKLATQMKFRLTEGQGECFYTIGISDSGEAIGLDKDELEDSLKVLYLITQSIEAQMSIMNYREGKEGLIGEILIRKEKDIKSDKLEIRIGLIGEEKSGKSSLVGVLVTDKLDNGKGLASTNVFRHKHEILCGKTSSFTHQIVGFDENGKMTNHSFFGKLSWPQIVDQSAKIVNFYDLGGSEKALKLSIKSLSPNYLDYLAIVVSASSGVTNDTVIFLKLALAMDLPVIIIVTKIDLLDEEDQVIFLNNLNYVIKAQKSKKVPLVTKTQEDIVMFSRIMNENIIPIFMISNKTGKGLNMFINFLNVLPSKCNVDDLNKQGKIQVRINSLILFIKV